MATMENADRRSTAAPLTSTKATRQGEVGMSLLKGRGRGLPVLFLSLLLLPAALQAQYFGRQKVQYENFDWQVMQTAHFQIHFYPTEGEITKDAARQAERWYTRLSRAFQHEFNDKPLIFYADHPDFQQTNVIGESIGEGTGGVTEGLRTRVIMPYTGVYADNDHVLGHELVHQFQYDMAQSTTGSGLSGLARLPLWLIEGMAEYLSLGREDAHTAMWLRDAALRGELPTIKQLTTDTRFFPYRYGQALWAYIAGRWGDRAVTEVFRFATRSAGFEAALQRVLGTTPDQLSQDWITEIRSTYLPLIAGRQRPEDAGDPIIVDRDIGAMNLAPVVSPDGQRVAFYSRRNIFTVDLFIADSRTGRIVKKLTSPNRNQHFDALSFISSAGTFSPDGSKLAFVVFEQGDNRLAILDINSSDVERRIEVRGVGAISNPAWSPDGRSIVFSGMAGGISDLYLMDVASGQARKLTNDKYGDLHPAWSPDGRTVAFASDRSPGTNFDELVFGPMVLAFVDVATGRVETRNVFPGAKHINPQYSPDGKDLYFIADREGFSDIYRLELATNTPYQVTRVATGVSGITDISPAMTVASRNGRLMFSVFENSGNNIYGIDGDRARGEPVNVVAQAPGSMVAAGLLPPVNAAGSGMVADYLANPTEGLPPPGGFETREYNTSIALDYLGPPSFGVGVNNVYGPGVAGGVSAYFGDMLGNHFIGTAIQANGTFKDIGGEVLYWNLGNRLNWGIGAGHIPYLTGFATVRPGNISGQPVRIIDQFLDRIYIDRASLLTRYPLSTTRRLELGGGYTRYGFDREIERYITDTRGRILDVTVVDTTAPPAINFFEASIAFVGDNSFFGFTSPVVGQRFRFEVSPTLGSLKYTAVLADFRRYFLAKPFTFAFRGMHYGRYGSDANGILEEQQQRVLTPLYLGYETLIRGYAQESFTGAECHPSPESPNGCPAFDRLQGTRLGIANFEFRIPLFGVREFGLLNFPFLPTEIAPFVDAGIAWSADEPIVWEFASQSGKRIPVFSAGVTSRFNILGYFVLEVYYAYPFQRPDRGAHFGFNLNPGW
jgi:Tol biopolymer transport system component